MMGRGLSHAWDELPWQDGALACRRVGDEEGASYPWGKMRAGAPCKCIACSGRLLWL